MKEKLNSYVEKLFEDAPKTKRAYDLREEILSNSKEKYDDLVSSGKSAEESYNMAISNIGDVSELINNLKESDVLNYANTEAQRKKSAILISIAVGLYIFSIIPIIIIESIDANINEVFGIVPMFLMIGIATMILVYNGVSKPKYNGMDDTMVEEFKEWKSKKDNTKSKKDSIQSAMWSIITVFYFIISFAFMSWAYSWIIFLIGGAISKIIDAIME